MRRLGFQSFVWTGGQAQVGAGTAMERTVAAGCRPIERAIDMKWSEAERRRATSARP